MANESLIEISEQYYSKYPGPLDAKLTPVANLEGLKNVKRANRYVGMTVLVLDDGTGRGPAEYWLVGGTANGNWLRKSNPITIEGDDVENV